MLTQEFVLSSDLVEHGDSDPYILRILLKFVKHFGTNALRELSNFQRYIIKLWYKNATCTKCSSLYEPEVFMGQLSINDNIAVSMNFQSRGFEAPQDPIEMFLTSQWRSPQNPQAVGRTPGAVSIRKTVLPGMAIPMLKIRRPNGRLIFNMEITIRR